MFSDNLYYVSRCLHNTAHRARRTEAANMAALWVSHFDVTHSHGCHNIHGPILFSLSPPLVWHTRQKWQPSSRLKLFSLLMAYLIENIPGNPLYDEPPFWMLTEIGMCLKMARGVCLCSCSSSDTCGKWLTEKANRNTLCNLIFRWVIPVVFTNMN